MDQNWPPTAPSFRVSHVGQWVKIRQNLVKLTLSQSGNIRHSPLESICEIEFRVVVNLAVKTCPRLLRQVIVAVDERRPEKNPLDSLVDVELLIGVV